MFRAVVLLALASVLLTALALISCLSIEDKRQIRGMPRAAWVAVILLVPVGGAVAWFLAGRPRPAGGSRVGRTIGGGILPEPPRPRAPDDDPEFLRSLDRDPSSEEELLRRWEEDLQKPDSSPPPDTSPPDAESGGDQPRRDRDQRDREKRDRERRDQQRRDEQQRRDLGTDG